MGGDRDSLSNSSSGRSRAAVSCLVGLLFLAACAESGFTYVTDSQTNTFFKVPEEWAIYKEDEILASQSETISPQREAVARALQYVVAFDGAPNPSLIHVMAANSDHPAGWTKVRVLNDQERDTFSLASIRNAVLPVDQLVKRNNAEIISQEDVVRPGGLHGSRLVFNIKEETQFVTINQTGLVDPSTRVLYLFVIGCEANCYVDNEEVINEVVSSWTIKAD